jgi:altered-inheritance-of-mitochondria protein 13
LARQSDSTRSANLELKIQSRLNAELSKLAEAESVKLAETTRSLSAKDDDPSDDAAGPAFLTDPTGEQARKKQLSHESVSKEIVELRKKLAGRKKLEETDPGVESARESLVQCLRLNDRRPLDCWEQREAFKREVGRLEKKFVDKTLK